MRSLLLLLICGLGLEAPGSDLLSPAISRVFPLGGQRGTTLDLEILGEYLSNATTVEFDCADIAWAGTTYASSGKLGGSLAIAPGAPLGTHLLRVRTPEGFSKSALFNVGQFPDLREVEPNDRPGQAQAVPDLPVEVQGALEGAADVDVYAIEARAGQRWSIDLRSIEHGSAVEAKMFLLTTEGRRVAFNDDRNDYLESPFIEHTFARDGKYLIKIDQYRGPRGFNFGKSSTYTLGISALPTIHFASPLGAEVGRNARIALYGKALDDVSQVHLTALRGAEYARMTFPYTMPVHFRPDPPRSDRIPRIEGTIVRRSSEAVEAEFAIPEDSDAGLWRIRASGTNGVAEGPIIELSRHPDFSESAAPEADWRDGGYAINGALEKPGERDVFAIHVVAGEPLHFWTLATQLGVPHLDPVLSLRDREGKRVAENDDVVAGQGTLLGNPDSSLFYTPEQDGVLFLTLEDRTKRGGPSYQYRLKVRSELPGFQLFTTPENFAVERGGEAEIKVHLVREEGFEGPVSVWFEGMPPAVEAPRARFRADQLFVPNADGADMIIPEIAFRIGVPDSLPPGTYPIRVFGTPAGEESSPDRRVVEARSTLIMGPLLDLWNFVRRPLPSIELTALDPLEARLSSSTKSVTVVQGGEARLELTASNVPEDSSVRVEGLPPNVAFSASHQGDQVIVTLKAALTAPAGTYDISAEALVRGRWAPTGVIGMKVASAARLRARQ